MGYLEAQCIGVDPEAKRITCRAARAELPLALVRAGLRLPRGGRRRRAEHVRRARRPPVLLLLQGDRRRLARKREASSISLKKEQYRRTPGTPNVFGTAPTPTTR